MTKRNLPPDQPDPSTGRPDAPVPSAQPSRPRPSRPQAVDATTSLDDFLMSGEDALPFQPSSSTPEEKQPPATGAAPQAFPPLPRDRPSQRRAVPSIEATMALDDLLIDEASSVPGSTSPPNVSPPATVPAAAASQSVPFPPAPAGIAAGPPPPPLMAPLSAVTTSVPLVAPSTPSEDRTERLWSKYRGEAEPPVQRTPMPIPKVRPPAAFEERQATREALDLVWFDSGSVRRIRRQEDWRRIVRELQNKVPDPELDDAAPGSEPAQIEDRREIFEILVRGTPVPAEGVAEALNAGVRADGKYIAPVRLLEGELTMLFDDLEVLRATVAATAPALGASDQQLRDAVTAAQEFLRLEESSSAPLVGQDLKRRIDVALGRSRSANVTPAVVEEQVARAVLVGRRYQRRTVLGGEQICARMQPARSDELIPTYIPVDVASLLPLEQKLRVRVIAELHLRVERFEAHRAALRVLALGRVVEVRG